MSSLNIIHTQNNSNQMKCKKFSISKSNHRQFAAKHYTFLRQTQNNNENKKTSIMLVFALFCFTAKLR